MIGSLLKGLSQTPDISKLQASPGFGIPGDDDRGALLAVGSDY